MKKNEFKTEKLLKGEVNIYDFESVKLYAYKTNDFLSDEVFIIEKNGKSVIIEQPCFFDNIKEFSEYIESKNLMIEGKLLSYHMAGASFLTDVPVYATKNASDFSHTGGAKALIENFTAAFGEIFDKSISDVTNYISEGPLNISGIDFNIIMTQDAFNIEIPELGAVYTHMLGHNCHSIVAGGGHAEAIISELEKYINEGKSLILTSHYTPEDLKDAQIKIDYIKSLKQIADESAGADEFKFAVAGKYPNYGGANYLDMTAGFFFPQKQ